MSSVFKKIAALAATVALASQNVLPIVLQAEAKAPATQTGSIQKNALVAPPALKERLKRQKDALRKSGKVSEYESVSIKWDDASAEPSQIRNLKRRASSDVAKDVSAVMDDLAPLY